MLQLKSPHIDYKKINPVHLLSSEFGWSCDRIAEKIGYSGEAVKSWSCGRRNPSPRALQKVHEVWSEEKQRREGMKKCS